MLLHNLNRMRDGVVLDAGKASSAARGRRRWCNITVQFGAVAQVHLPWMGLSPHLGWAQAELEGLADPATLGLASPSARSVHACVW